MFLTAERTQKRLVREIMFQDLNELPGYVGLTGPEYQCINAGTECGAITKNTDITVAERENQSFQILQSQLTQNYPRAQVFNQYLEHLELHQLPKQIGLVNNDIFGNVDNVSLKWLATVVRQRLVTGGTLAQTFTKHYRANSFIPLVMKMLRGGQDYIRAAHDRDITNNADVPSHSREIATVYYLLFRDYVLHGYDFRVAFCCYEDTQNMIFMKCYDITPKPTNRPIMELPNKPDPRPRIRLQSIAVPPGKTLGMKKLLAKNAEEKRYVEQEIMTLQLQAAAQGKNPKMVRAGIEANETKWRNELAVIGFTAEKFRQLVDDGVFSA